VYDDIHCYRCFHTFFSFDCNKVQKPTNH
jgi:hypothetical protein